MAEPKNIPERTRHPDLWVVEAVRWEFREHESEYQRLLAKKRDKGPGVQLGQQIDRAEVPDRPYAVAIAHHLLDRHAEEAAGRMSLEIHIYPPEKDIEDESAYRVTDEVLEQARQLGIEGDVEAEIKRMARDGTPYTHPRANLRHGPYALRIEANDVVWLGLADAPGGRRKPK
jgi:hypothetical protein